MHRKKDFSPLNLANFIAFPQIPVNGFIRTCTFVINSLVNDTCRLDEVMNDKVNTVWISVKSRISKKSIAVGNFYREWSARGQGRNSLQDQIDDLSELEKQIDKCQKFDNLIIGGDWNIDLERYYSDKENFDRKTLAETLQGLAQRNGLKHIEYGITRIGRNGQRDSAIDFFYVRNSEKIISKENMDEMISNDHRMVSIDISLNRKETLQKNVVIREKISDNITAALDLAGILNSAGILDEQNVTKSAKRLDVAMQLFLDKHMPKKEITVKEKKSNDFDPEIAELIKVKKKLAKFYKFTGEKRLNKEAEFKKIRNKISNLVKRNQRNRIYEELNKKDAWKVAKNIVNPNQIREKITLVHNDVEISDPTEIAKIINEYYIDKIVKLVNGIDTSQMSDPYIKLKSYMKDKDTSFSFQKVGSAEVSKAIKKMKRSNAAGMDEISSNLIKDFESELLPYIVHVVNRSIMSNIFPENWKIAKVLPLFKKKGKKTEVKNYRPVSNLITFSKILESILESQLRHYFETNKYIFDSQYGFRKARGTNLALLEATTRWKELRKQRKHIGICFFDLSAAFDCLNKDILDKKLEIYGVQPGARKLIYSYLSERKQVVEVDSGKSTTLIITTGSPQGSILSPLLYIIFVGDLPLWLEPDVDVITFADDTSIFVGSESESEIKSILEKNSVKIFEYFSSNKLVANKDKTCFLFVDKVKNKVGLNDRELNIGSVVVKESQAEKLLGLKIDNNLDWSNHVKDTVNNVNHNLYQLRKLRSKVTDKQLKIFGQGMAMSKLNYACSAYANSYLASDEKCQNVDVNKRLQKCQNDLLRVVTKNKLQAGKNNAKIEDMLAETKYLSINQLVAQQQLMSGWSIINNNIEPLKSMVTGQSTTNTGLRSVSSGHIKPNSENLTSFPSQLKRLWNNKDLSQNFRVAESKSSAKNIAKKFVLESVPPIPWKRDAK